MIRILLVDDQKTILYGIKALLETNNDFEIVGLAENGQEAIDQAVALQPDIALIDMYMPVLNGAEATKAICLHCPSVKVLLLSASSDESTVLETLKAGAMGYLLKNTSPDELATAIRSIHKGFTHFGPGIFNPSILTSQTTPTETKETLQKSDTASELAEFLQQPDAFSQIDRFLEDVATVQEATELQMLLTQYSRQKPDNWLPYYLTGQLQMQVMQDASSALKSFLLAFNKSLGSNHTLKYSLSCCNEIMTISGPDAVDCCSRLIQKYRTDNQLEQLMRFASSYLSQRSKCYQCLFGLWQIIELEDLLNCLQQFQAA